MRGGPSQRQGRRIPTAGLMLGRGGRRRRRPGAMGGATGCPHSLHRPSGWHARVCRGTSGRGPMLDWDRMPG